MKSQEITIQFTAINFEGDDAKKACQMLMTNGLSFTRSAVENLEADDDSQTTMLTDLSLKDEQMLVEDAIEDEIECVLSDDLDDFELVDYKINWSKSAICV